MTDKSAEAAAEKMASGGREGGGQSGGGAFKDRDQPKKGGHQGGFFGHGGQSEIAYHGATDQEASDENPNAATKE